MPSNSTVTEHIQEYSKINIEVMYLVVCDGY